jgi:putative DNA primase/helicase
MSGNNLCEACPRLAVCSAVDECPLESTPVSELTDTEFANLKARQKSEAAQLARLDQNYARRLIEEGKLPEEALPEGARPMKAEPESTTDTPSAPPPPPPNATRLPIIDRVLEKSDNETAQILRPIIAEALRRASTLAIENEPFDDVANAAIFRNLFDGFAAIVPGQGWRIFVASRGIWLADYDRNLIKRLGATVGLLRREAVGLADDFKGAAKHATYSCSAYGIRSMLDLAESEPALVYKREAFDTDPDAILDAAGNRIDLRTLETRKATAADRFTRALGVTYDPAATCPTFDHFILEAMEGDHEAVAFLQREVGYSFTGQTREQKLLVNVGKGSNGKGTASNLFEYIAGAYARTVKAEAFVPVRGQATGYDLAELPGVRLVFVKETSKGAGLDEALVKTATGGDTLSARAPYQRPFTFKPSFKLWIETNEAPRIRGRGLAIWRRILRLDWNFTVPPERVDERLEEKLQAEGSGVLNWILAGAREWYAEGLGMPRKVADAIAAYKDATDTLGDFLAGFWQAPGLQAPSSALYAKYKAWAQESGLATLSTIKFKEELLERGFDFKRTEVGRFFLGISLDTPPNPPTDRDDGPTPSDSAEPQDLFDMTDPEKNDGPSVISVTSPIRARDMGFLQNDGQSVMPSAVQAPEPDPLEGDDIETVVLAAAVKYGLRSLESAAEYGGVSKARLEYLAQNIPEPQGPPQAQEEPQPQNQAATEPDSFDATLWSLLHPGEVQP